MVSSRGRLRMPEIPRKEGPPTMTTVASPSSVLGRVAKLHRGLEKAGLTYDDIQFVIDNPRISGLIVTLVHGETTSTARTREPLQITVDLETVMETEFFLALCTLSSESYGKFREYQAEEFLTEWHDFTSKEKLECLEMMLSSDGWSAKADSVRNRNIIISKYGLNGQTPLSWDEVGQVYGIPGDSARRSAGTHLRKARERFLRLSYQLLRERNAHSRYP